MHHFYCLMYQALGPCALVKSTTDAPHVFHDLSSNIGTNNIYVHVFMVPTYTWLKANSNSCPNVSRDFMLIAQRCNSPKKILLGLVYRAFTTIGFFHVKNNNLLCMWFQATPLKILWDLRFFVQWSQKYSPKATFFSTTTSGTLLDSYWSHLQNYNITLQIA